MSDDEHGDADEGLVVVPHRDLSASALHGVIESFVLREGTDYGEVDVPLATKIEQVRQQIDRGEAEIVFDLRSESIDIRPVTPSMRRDRTQEP